MVTRLVIKNYALIKHLEMSPSGNLNVITGETGAGKSIMLGALGLLLGNRADTKVLWNAAEKCIIEGTFNLSGHQMSELFLSEDLDYDEETTFRREISPQGKSRAFINDTPVTLEVMKNLGRRLMDIHSQHETLDLGNRHFQLNLVDTFAGTQTHLVKDYKSDWHQYQQAKLKLETLIAESNALKSEADYIQFQLRELREAHIIPGELGELESQLKILEHAEDIKLRFNKILSQSKNADQSIDTSLHEILNDLSGISEYSPSYQKLANRLNSLLIEFKDILSEVESEEENIEYDSDRIEEVKDRISLLYQLLQKHKLINIEELLALQLSLESKVEKTVTLDEAVLQAEINCTETQKKVALKAKELSGSRKKAFSSLCTKLEVLLKDLGMPNAQLKIDHKKIDPGPDGADFIEFLFSANKGIDPQPLARVASGGEFSRLMFCVKYILAEKEKLPTLVLDEIDNGISGEIALRLGKMMKVMAIKHQLITITHLPQIAAKGDSHYFVFKNNETAKTVTEIRKLGDKERISEIAQMIGGSQPSALALENARELLVSQF